MNNLTTEELHQLRILIAKAGLLRTDTTAAWAYAEAGGIIDSRMYPQREER